MDDTMQHNLYAQFNASELILRDHLAVDRTLLANERTLLSYLRSGVALFIAGISIIHFSNQGWFAAFGLLCLPSGVATALFGFHRFRQMNRAILVIRQELKHIEETAEGVTE